MILQQGCVDDLYDIKGEIKGLDTEKWILRVPK